MCGQLLLAAKWIRFLPEDLDRVLGAVHLDVGETGLQQVLVEDAHVGLLLNCDFKDSPGLDCSVGIFQEVGHGLLAFLR